MCGDSFLCAVKAVFATHLYHGGYLRLAEAAAGRLYTLYKEKDKDTEVESVGAIERGTDEADCTSHAKIADVTLTTNNSSSSSSRYEQAIQQKPPGYLLAAWEQSMKIRVTSRSILLSQPPPPSSSSSSSLIAAVTSSSDMRDQELLSPQDLSLIMHSRAMFLLQVEACSCDRQIEHLGDTAADPFAFTASCSSGKDVYFSNNSSVHDFEAVMKNVLTFISDPMTSIPHVKAILKRAQGQMQG